jgi:hypothetical protein
MDAALDGHAIGVISDKQSTTASCGVAARRAYAAAVEALQARS